MFYLKLNNEGFITDCIDYEFEGYVPYEGEVPQSCHAGWFKLEDGIIVEYPELKPPLEDMNQELLELQVIEQNNHLREMVVQGVITAEQYEHITKEKY